MKPSIIFRIHRVIRFVLQGIGKKEQEHLLFTIGRLWSDVEAYCTLVNHGWQPNYLGYVYRHQVYQCRRLVNFGQHQYHVRYYDDGRVSGHFEIAPEWSTKQHLKGVDLRTMNASEKEELEAQLGGVIK